MIRIITVGKLKEKFFVDATNEYVKRISKYSKIELIEVNDEDNNNLDAMDKEGKKILKHIKDDYVITLEIEGKMLDSIELSNLISSVNTYDSSIITFVIGGSLGLSDEVKSRANYHLSFSKMTFPHMLMRVILLEQIYRSFKILNKEPYHK